MTDSIGKRIDALQGRIAGLQSRLETVQRELNEVKLEYVRNDEIQRRETARANADNLVVDAVGEVPPVDLPVADRGHCCLDLECYQASTYPTTGHCDCLGGEPFPPCHREEQGRIGRKEWEEREHVYNVAVTMMRLVDPDCRDGKHASCVGGPCECSCHELAMRG